jgi:tRNA dimethylallyltransferase
MFQRGLVEETEQLLKHGLAQNRNALQALGYRQVADFLLGTRSLAEARERVKTRTRHFAKRQMTWFRRQMQLQWVEIAAGESARKTAQRLVAELCVSPSRGTLQNE